MVARTELELPTGEIPVDVETHFNNRGITAPDQLARGQFNIWDNSFPANELPSPGGTIQLGAIPFRFPAQRPDGADNFRCVGQLIDVPPGAYDWIYLLAASERRSEDAMYLHYADGTVDPEWLRVSDFWAETPAHFGEQEGLHCTALHYPRHIQRRMGPSIWRTRVPVPRETDLAALHMPDNPAIHVFAITLVARPAIGAAA
ncbi:MAG: hypothetical protein ACJ74O_10740 [Frankiaceae bacterium]